MREKSADCEVDDRHDYEGFGSEKGHKEVAAEGAAHQHEEDEDESATAQKSGHQTEDDDHDVRQVSQQLFRGLKSFGREC
jgi:hypothetical protein